MNSGYSVLDIKQLFSLLTHLTYSVTLCNYGKTIRMDQKN